MSHRDSVRFPMYDPLIVFLKNATPAGLDARKKWVGEGSAMAWERDCHRTVEPLHAGQKENGSWEDSPLTTIRTVNALGHLDDERADVM